jgi:hypothetical protein
MEYQNEHPCVIPKERQKWEESEADGESNFKVSEDQNGLVATKTSSLNNNRKNS